MKRETKNKDTDTPSAGQEEDRRPPDGKKAVAGTVTLNKKEYDDLCRSAAEFKDKYIRLYAEFDNVRKRFEREKLEFVRYANQDLIVEFLSIQDDLQRIVDAAGAKHQDYESFLKGVEMIMAHLYEMLKRNGLKSVEAVGKPFDPHCHEILMQEQTDQHEDGTVLEEFQKGYYLGDRVVRTAKVKVAVRPEPAAADQNPGPGEDDKRTEQDNQDK